MDPNQTTPYRSSDGGSASWLNIVLGIWVIISPFALAFGMFPRAMWNNVATGAAIVILAIIRTSTPQQPGWSWSNAILGIWLIISPFVLAFAMPVALWNNVILGIIIAIVALANAATTRTTRHAV
jgi:hypothetical protein